MTDMSNNGSSPKYGIWTGLLSLFHSQVTAVLPDYGDFEGSP